MSQWSRLARMLQSTSLDREIKLMLIDLLSTVQDPKLEQDIFSFMFAWEEAQAQTQKQLTEGLKMIVKTYEDQKQQLDTTTQKELLSMTDDLARQKRIESLKKSIERL